MHRRLDTRQAAGRIIALLEAELAAAGYELVDVRIFRGGGRLQVRVYLDTAAGGITLDQCAQASRTVGMLLEEADLRSLKGRVTLPALAAALRSQPALWRVWLTRHPPIAALLEEALEARSAGLVYLHIDPAYDSLHDDPRFADIVSRVGLKPG